MPWRARASLSRSPDCSAIWSARSWKESACDQAPLPEATEPAVYSRRTRQVVGAGRLGRLESLRQDRVGFVVAVLLPEHVRERREHPRLEPGARTPRGAGDGEGPFVVGARLGEPAELLARLPSRERRLGEEERALAGRQRVERRESLVVPADRLLRCEHAAMPVPCEHRVAGGALGVRGLLRVVAEDLGELLVAAAGRVLDPGDHGRVGLDAPRAGQARVRDVAREDVVEHQLPLAGERRRLALPDEAGGDQGVELGVGVATTAEPGDRARPERPPDDRRVLDRALLGRRQEVDARCDDALHGVRKRRRQLARQLPRLAAGSSVPSSTIISRSSLAKNGLPSARSTIRAATSPGIVPPRSSPTRWFASEAEQRRQRDRRRVRDTRAPAGAPLPELRPGRADREQLPCRTRGQALDEL